MASGVLIAAMMGVVVAVLAIGLFAMARGKGAADAKLSNKMMRWRIVLQGLLVAALLLSFLFTR